MMFYRGDTSLSGRVMGLGGTSRTREGFAPYRNCWDSVETDFERRPGGVHIAGTSLQNHARAATVTRKTPPAAA